MTKNKIGFLGYGEIGQAVKKLYENSSSKFEFFIKDLDRNDGLEDVDVLNVAIPFNDAFNFIDVVKSEIISSKAKLVIIHSTVAVGTTRALKNFLPNVAIVHSPCRGVHPNLYEGLLTFPKFIGSIEGNDSLAAAHHLSLLNVKTLVCENSETTELAKLLDTSYYGICIAYHGEAKKACEKFGANFEQVMTAYNHSYNEGYTKLGKPNVVRPVLSPPLDGIGGHCVVENAELLSKQFDSLALKLITSYKRNK
jgi:UDP-N-acetyl-D-mannosaminuronate dehydrogenase